MSENFEINFFYGRYRNWVDFLVNLRKNKQLKINYIVLMAINFRIFAHLQISDIVLRIY